MDLFNNPMVTSARKAMTPEQIENYKKIGEYMYNNPSFKFAEQGTNVKKADSKDFLEYAVHALRSGGDPNDLSQEEIRELVSAYGEKWYENFGFLESEVPKGMFQLSTTEQILQEVEKQSKKLNLSRQQRRAVERKLKKQKSSLGKEQNK
jgi:hypothetical protein